MLLPPRNQSVTRYFSNGGFWQTQQGILQSRQLSLQVLNRERVRLSLHQELPEVMSLGQTVCPKL